jgi:acyl transferase domain-containing protein
MRTTIFRTHWRILISRNFRNDAIDATEEVKLNMTAFTQPALFALEWSLYSVWLSEGVIPDVVLGHSIGEIVAACVSGIMTMETAMKLVIERGN